MEIKLCVKNALTHICHFGNFIKLQGHEYLKKGKWKKLENEN